MGPLLQMISSQEPPVQKKKKKKSSPACLLFIVCFIHFMKSCLDLHLLLVSGVSQKAIPDGMYRYSYITAALT